MKRRLLALVLSVAMILGLIQPALASGGCGCQGSDGYVPQGTRVPVTVSPEDAQIMSDLAHASGMVDAVRSVANKLLSLDLDEGHVSVGWRSLCQQTGEVEDWELVEIDFPAKNADTVLEVFCVRQGDAHRALGIVAESGKRTAILTPEGEYVPMREDCQRCFSACTLICGMVLCGFGCNWIAANFGVCPDTCVFVCTMGCGVGCSLICGCDDECCEHYDCMCGCSSSYPGYCLPCD